MNPLKNIQEKMAEKKQVLEAEQLQRIERLRELEEAKNKKGFYIPNPVKAVKNKKEMSALKKEIVAFEERKKKQKVLVGCGITLAVLFILTGVMAFTGDKGNQDKAIYSDNTSIEVATVTSTENEPVEQTSSVPISDEAEQKTLVVKNDESSIEESKDKEIITETTQVSVDEVQVSTETPENVEQTEVESAPETEEWSDDIMIFTADDLSVSTLNDYAHISTETIILGNDEGAKIEIKAPADMTYEDLVVYDEDESLVIKHTDTISESGKTVFKLYVTGKKQGYHDLLIFTLYDLSTKGDEASGFSLRFNKLDKTDGRVVYVTPTGEKYHFSASCAGDNSIKTTYYDAFAYEYDPCGKCAD